uniref:Uncharacterized protein n=1 Tax=Panagrolaimus sp. ES5 TaxID=591445 RepID=A0AC34FZW2_9BILA
MDKLDSNIKLFDTKIEEIKNLITPLQKSLSELSKFAHGKNDESVRKIESLQQHANQIQQKLIDLNGYSRGHLEKVVPSVNSLNDFRNKWAGQLPNMQERLNIHKQNLFAITQCTKEKSTVYIESNGRTHVIIKEPGCLTKLGYKNL